MMTDYETLILIAALLSAFAWLALANDIRRRVGATPIIDRSTANTLMVAALFTGMTFVLFFVVGVVGRE